VAKPRTTSISTTFVPCGCPRTASAGTIISAASPFVILLQRGQVLPRLRKLDLPALTVTQKGRGILQQPNLRQARTRELVLRKPQERQALATLACLPWLLAEFPNPSQASPYLVLTAKASLTKLLDPSQASPTLHQQPRHLDKAAKPTVSRYIPWSKFPPREHFVPKGFSKSFLPNSSGYGVITTTNLAIPAHKDGSKNTSNQVFSQLLRCHTTLTNTPILVR
jgi:hypothetical protein